MTRDAGISLGSACGAWRLGRRRFDTSQGSIDSALTTGVEMFAT